MSKLLAALILLAIDAPGRGRRPKSPALPEPRATPSVIKHPKVVGWPDGKKPTAPAGFEVTAFVQGIDNPRWIYVLPNGDVLISQGRTVPKAPPKPEDDKDPKKKGLKESKTVTGTSANRITLLRDADKDGNPEVRETFLAA